MSYLDNGGNLYIESVNLGYDYHTTTFFEYLGLAFEYDGDEQEVLNITGSEESLMPGLGFNYFGGYSPHYSIDRMSPAGSNELFTSEDGYGRMFVNEQNGYKVISSSILLGAIASGDSLNLKPYLVSEMVNYFLDYNPVTSFEENVAELFSVRNYPNPFASETKIECMVNKSGKVSIDILNSSGRRVRRLFNGDADKGRLSVIWDGTNDRGNKIENGVYFYKINGKGFSRTGKMVLLR